MYLIRLWRYSFLHLIRWIQLVESHLLSHIREVQLIESYLGGTAYWVTFRRCSSLSLIREAKLIGSRWGDKACWVTYGRYSLLSHVQEVQLIKSPLGGTACCVTFGNYYILITRLRPLPHTLSKFSEKTILEHWTLCMCFTLSGPFYLVESLEWRNRSKKSSCFA